MRDRRLKRIKAIIQREKRVSAESDDDRLLVRRQHRRMRLLWPCGAIGHRRPFLPFGDRLLIDTVTLGERPQALLTILYCSTDRLCRAGAPVNNLAHSASFHSKEKTAPSNAGTKHLVLC